MVTFDIRKFSSLDSTNTYLKTLAEDGAKEGVVIIANTQTSGRGRRGKSFYSPEGTGLYMSILLRPPKNTGDITLITTAAAVALSLAIEKVYKKEVLIKWVNDIYLGERKLAGILTEGSFSNSAPNYIVLGIGVNLTTESFPDEIKDIAVSLGENKKEELLQEILIQFNNLYENISSPEIHKEYVKRSFLMGKEVNILSEKELSGTVVGIDRNFRLEVELENKDHIFLSSGDVSVRLKK